MLTTRAARTLCLRILSLTVLLLLLAACARGVRPPGSDEPALGQEPNPAEEVPWVVPQALADLGIRNAADEVVHQQFEPYEVVGSPGIYLLDIATGRLDFWALANADFAQYDVTADNRWIQAWSTQDFYLIDRHESTAVAWPINQKGALAAMGDRVLFAGPDGYILTSRGLLEAAPLEGLTPPEGSGSREVALFSKDARHLALVRGTALHVVETETGRLTELPEIAPDGPDRTVAQVFLDYSNQDDEFVVSVLSQGGDQEGSLVSYRYAWTGEPRGEFRPAVDGSLSPDGTLAASWGYLTGVVPYVTVFDATSGEPLFRMRGVTLCDSDLWMIDRPWLSDSSGLVVDAAGQYRILTREGELNDSPAFHGHSGLFREPQPAPDRPDLFAVGRTKVVDATGRVLAEAKLAENQDPGHLNPWGFTSGELRFVLPHLGHGGRCGGYPGLGGGPLLERPPFQEEVRLEPDLAEGDCVSLRSRPGLEAEEVTCLPGGSLLTLVGDDGSGPTVDYVGGDTWVLVRTESGQTGWVPAKAGNLKWAE